MSVICLASWWLNFPVHARGHHMALSVGPISVHEDSFEKAPEKLEKVRKKSLQCIICYVVYFKLGSSWIFLCFLN